MPELSPEEIYENLPPAFRRQWDGILSLDGMLRLIRDFGGCPLYVPYAMPRDSEHPLARCLSPADLEALVRVAAGETLDIPNAARLRHVATRKQIRHLAAEGVPAVGIARRLGVTTRWIRMVLGRAAANPRSPT
jgi:hypothetical protein